MAPSIVRLAWTCSFAASLHFTGGVSVAPFHGDYGSLTLGVFSELTLGMVLGLVAALPFDSARIGGRFIDLFRGASAEASLPQVGIKESASGDILFQLLLAMVSAGPGYAAIAGALWKSFALVKLGLFSSNQGVALEVVGLTGGALATGLCIGAPIAAAGLALDGLVGVVSRISSGLSLRDSIVPMRLLGGAAMMWLGIGLILNRLTDQVFKSSLDVIQLIRLVR